MKLLSTSDNCGHYRDENGDFASIDRISKDDLLRLVNLTLDEENIEFDEYDESKIKNRAHQVIYKSILQKLRSLRSRKDEYLDESARLFLKEYERYGGDTQKPR